MFRSVHADCIFWVTSCKPSATTLHAKFQVHRSLKGCKQLVKASSWAILASSSAGFLLLPHNIHSTLFSVRSIGSKVGKQIPKSGSLVPWGPVWVGRSPAPVFKNKARSEVLDGREYQETIETRLNDFDISHQIVAGCCSMCILWDVTEKGDPTSSSHQGHAR